MNLKRLFFLVVFSGLCARVWPTEVGQYLTTSNPATDACCGNNIGVLGSFGSETYTCIEVGTNAWGPMSPNNCPLSQSGYGSFGLNTALNGQANFATGSYVYFTSVADVQCLVSWSGTSTQEGIFLNASGAGLTIYYGASSSYSVSTPTFSTGVCYWVGESEDGTNRNVYITTAETSISSPTFSFACVNGAGTLTSIAWGLSDWVGNDALAGYENDSVWYTAAKTTAPFDGLQPTPTITPTSSNTPNYTPTPTYTASPTSTITPNWTHTDTPTVTPTNTPFLTNTPAYTNVCTPNPQLVKAKTPWVIFNNFGGTQTSGEKLIRDMGTAGLLAYGVTGVHDDNDWQASYRDPITGQILPVSAYFSDMYQYNQYIVAHGGWHSIYLDAGTEICGGGGGMGSYGHEMQDAQTVAWWGASALMVDGCYMGNENPQTEMALFQLGIATSSNPAMEFDLWNNFGSNPWVWGPGLGASVIWVNTYDTSPNWGSALSQWEGVLSLCPTYGGPGDYLLAGGCPVGQGVGDVFDRAVLDMWAAVKSPIGFNFDPSSAATSTLNIVKNNAVYEVLRDPNGIPQGEDMADTVGGYVVTSGPMSGAGQYSFLLVNNSGTSGNVTINFSNAGFPSGTAQIYSCDNYGALVGSATNSFSSYVTNTSAALFTAQFGGYTPTPSFTPVNTYTNTPAWTYSSTLSPTPNWTATISPVLTVTPTLTYAPPCVLTATPTITPTFSVSPTITATFTITKTFTITPTVTVCGNGVAFVKAQGYFTINQPVFQAAYNPSTYTAADMLCVMMATTNTDNFSEVAYVTFGNNSLTPQYQVASTYWDEGIEFWTLPLGTDYSGGGQLLTVTLPPTNTIIVNLMIIAEYQGVLQQYSGYNTANAQSVQSGAQPNNIYATLTTLHSGSMIVTGYSGVLDILTWPGNFTNRFFGHQGSVWASIDDPGAGLGTGAHTATYVLKNVNPAAAQFMIELPAAPHC